MRIQLGLCCESSNGQLYNVQTNTANLSVTTNHRMYVSNDGINYDLIKADQIIGKNMYYKNTANWIQKDLMNIFGKTYGDLDDVNNLLILFGFWLKHLIASEFTVTLLFDNIKNKELICNIVKNFDYLNMIYYDKIVVTDIDLSKNCKSIKNKKKLPDWIWRLSQQQMKLLVDIVIDQDKWYDKGDFVACEFIRMCLHAGVYCKVDECEENKKCKYKIVENVESPVTYNEELIDYDGPVFCLQVPGEIFFVKRCGGVCWTGNSRARGVRTLLLRQPPEGRSKDGGLASAKWRGMR